MPPTTRVQHLEQMLEFSCSLSTSPDLQSFLQSAITLTCKLTDSEEAAILVYDQATDRLRFIASASPIPEITSVTIPLDNSVAGWSYLNSQPVIVPDAAAESRHFRSLDQATGFTTRSLLAVPIIFRGQTLGVLEAVNKANSTYYTGDDVTILEMLAAQLATALTTDPLLHIQQSIDSQATLLEQMKSNFIAVASHEFRTPLGLILGYTTFLREQTGVEHHAYLDKIIENAIKLKEIVEDLSNANNYENDKAVLRQQHISLNAIINDVILSFSNNIRAKQQNLSVTIENELYVLGDAEKLAIALGSLVKNAITFTETGGKIVIHTETIPGYIKICVEDDGIGIPAEDLTRIFERFYQVESHLTRQHGGMGLGLSVARMIIELHGGRIWAENNAQSGSTFIILLPADEA